MNFLPANNQYNNNVNQADKNIGYNQIIYQGNHGRPVYQINSLSANNQYNNNINQGNSNGGHNPTSFTAVQQNSYFNQNNQNRNQANHLQ